MPILNLWPKLEEKDFWLIDGQYNMLVEQNLVDDWLGGSKWSKENFLNVWKVVVVWLDNKTGLCDISKYLNMGNMKRAYQKSWIWNIMVF